MQCPEHHVTCMMKWQVLPSANSYIWCFCRGNLSVSITWYINRIEKFMVCCASCQHLLSTSFMLHYTCISILGKSVEWFCLFLFTIIKIHSDLIFVSHAELLTEAQRYHCEYNFTAARFILLPRVLFWPPRVLFYCCEIYFNGASFILLPRDLF